MNLQQQICLLNDQLQTLQDHYQRLIQLKHAQPIHRQQKLALIDQKTKQHHFVNKESSQYQQQLSVQLQSWSEQLKRVSQGQQSLTREHNELSVRVELQVKDFGRVEEQVLELLQNIDCLKLQRRELEDSIKAIDQQAQLTIASIRQLTNQHQINNSTLLSLQSTLEALQQRQDSLIEIARQAGLQRLALEQQTASTEHSLKESKERLDQAQVSNQKQINQILTIRQQIYKEQQRRVMAQRQVQQLDSLSLSKQQTLAQLQHNIALARRHLLRAHKMHDQTACQYDQAVQTLNQMLSLEQYMGRML